MSPTQSSVHWLPASDEPPLSEVEGATAQLTRTNSSVAYTFRTNGLERGHVVTMWWVIFNNPDECENPIPTIGANCDLPDLFNAAVMPSVMGGDGNLVGESGESTHAGHLREGEITTFHPAFVGSPGLDDAMKAEIHLVLRTHGPAIPDMLAEMRSTFDAGCDVNDCADLQAAAFPAP